jgi:thymidylate kinase
VFLDLNPKAALARISARGEAKEIYEKEETLALFRHTFMKVFESLPDRVAVVDASGTADEVAELVAAAVRDVL